MKKRALIAISGTAVIGVFFSGCSATIPLGPVVEPVAGGSCKDMENYFNRNFGRSDIQFSNFEGQIVKDVYTRELYCDGGVIIQTFPTGKKTCTGRLQYWNETKELKYNVNEYSTCFVSN